MPELSNVASADIYKTAQPQTGMSLADMLNISRSSLALQKEKELYAPSVEQAKAQSRLAQTQASSAEQKMPLEVQSLQTTLNTQKLENLTKQANTSIQAMQKLSMDNNLTADKIVKEATELNKIHGGSPEALQSVLQSLPQNATPTQLKGWLAQKQAQTLDSLAQLEKVYPAGILPGQLPSNQSYQQPPQQAEQPTSVTPQAMNLPEHSQPVKTPYPVRNPNSPYLPMPSEQADKDAGIQYRNNLVNRQSNLITDKRNIDEVINKAKELEKSAYFPTGGVLGTAERKVSQFLGTEQGMRYKELSKDLANAQMANMVAQGGSLDTVEGLRLKRLANGDETYPPNILINIAERTRADIRNLDMQATAAQKFATRFGDNNMKKFQQEWSKNADTKIFQIMDVAKDSNLTPQEKTQKAEKLLGPVGSQERKIADQKYRNLLKLQENGSLE
jgi:hypothetical protein